MRQAKPHIFLLVFLTGLAVSGLAFQTTAAESEPTPNVGIFLADSCQELNKMGSWTCPRYTQFLALDNSNPRVSGSMVWQEYDAFREESPIQNGIRYYDYVSEQLVIVDPPGSHVRELQLIIVTPSIQNYTLDGDLTIYHSLWIDGCNTVTVAAYLAYYPVLVDYLVQYLQDGCPEPSPLQAYMIPRELPQTETDITESAWWQYEQWLKEAQELCRERC